MIDLRTKIERAVAKANELVPGSRVDPRWAFDFLRALESEGLKVMDGEPTREMQATYDREADAMGTCWDRWHAMFAAAPTLADRLREAEADLASLAQRGHDEAVHLRSVVESAEAERDRLRTEVERMRSVIETARNWREEKGPVSPMAEHLLDALSNLDAALTGEVK